MCKCKKLFKKRKRDTFQYAGNLIKWTGKNNDRIKSPLYGSTLSILGKSSFHVGIVFLEKVNLVLLVQWDNIPDF